MPAPLLEINEEALRLLAQAGLTKRECAARLGCSHDTIERRYNHVYEQGLEKLKGSLRQKQAELALKGNVTMLIWLGKNLLGQSDKLEATGKNGEPLFPPVDREELIGKLLGAGTAQRKPDTVQ